MHHQLHKGANMNTQQATATRASKPQVLRAINHVLNDLVNSRAISYWAEIKSAKRDKDTGKIISFVVVDGGYENDPYTTEKKTISEKSLMAARKKMLLDDVDVHRDIAAQFVGPMDKWDYDLDGIDALVQVALFGKIIYG
jgi:hypothetical protein